MDVSTEIFIRHKNASFPHVLLTGKSGKYGAHLDHDFEDWTCRMGLELPDGYHADSISATPIESMLEVVQMPWRAWLPDRMATVLIMHDALPA